MNRIQSLDGLRAVSIIMVLLAHAGATLPEYISSFPLYHLIGNSDIGVRVFFVISGFLITKLLIHEKEKTGTISIKKFYVRRIVRIFPVFYLYILVLLLIKFFFIHSIFADYKFILVAGLFLWNYKFLFEKVVPGFDSNDMENGSWFFGHFWTLSTEEQYYLLWPWLFKKMGQEKLKKLVVIVIIGAVVFRIAVCFLMPSLAEKISLRFHYDAILTGCFFALLEKNTSAFQKVLDWLKRKDVQAFIILFPFVMSPLLAYYFRSNYKLLIGINLENISIALFVIWAVYIPSRFARFLNRKIMVQIGVLSYSLYIWQQLFLTNQITYWPNKFPQNLILAVVAGVGSYYLIEKPVLKLKKRFG